jgi:hypothetical protein
MLTDTFNSCRIHHNSDYAGDIYITNEDSTSNAIGKKATIKFTCQNLFNLYEKVKAQEVITISGLNDDDIDDEITILVEDMKSFTLCRIEYKIRDKLNTISNENLLKIADILGIK